MGQAFRPAVATMVRSAGVAMVPVEFEVSDPCTVADREDFYSVDLFQSVREFADWNRYNQLFFLDVDTDFPY